LSQFDRVRQFSETPPPPRRWLTGLCLTDAFFKTLLEQNRDWLRASRCLSRFCSPKNAAADGRETTNPQGSSSDLSRHRNDLMKFLSRMSKINCRRFEQNRDRLRTSLCLPRYCSSPHRSDFGFERHAANAFASGKKSTT
jgi:hypothetical protein